MRSASALLAALILFAGVSWAQAPLPEALTRALPQLIPLGSGAMHWFGLHVYDATLWTTGRSPATSDPQVLDIRYTRSIKGRRLADSSVKEMQRLGWSETVRMERWASAMQRVFPDVEPGDRLIGVNLPGRGAEFHSANGLLGRIDDPGFAQAFFAIWLDPRTREPGLRAALLGTR